jgi:4-amino-4-deoxy-L-arabinose transferase-like glycosyltransferase
MAKTIFSAELFRDIRFWIILFFAVRLYGITNPPLETGHNWRQTTVTMAARNFLEAEDNILHPRIDIAGEKTGITGMEFPVLNYMITLTAKALGYQHWYGRLINLLISSFGLWYFYLLLKKYFHEPVAFHATLILAVSVWFQFSRKIMPDTFAMSFIIAGIYYCSNYLENEGRKSARAHLCAGVLLILTGTMSKLPAAYILVVFALWLPVKSIPIGRKFLLYLLLTIVMIPVAWWYFSWVPHLVKTYGFEHFFMGKSMSRGVAEIAAHMDQTLAKFYDVALKFIGFAAFLYGLYLMFKTGQSKLKWILGLSFAAFLVIIFKAGFTFYHHNYYIIPFVPVMALIAGYATASIEKKTWGYLLLAAIAVEGIANQWHEFRVKPQNQFLVNIENELDSVSGRSDLLIINSGNYPTPMYFTHRKGWVDNNRNISSKNYQDSLKNLGLKHILILKKSFGTDTILQDLPLILDNENYRLYGLEKK